ncbi:hypothetical protein TIFTF001_032468 [Ficus carica]|uniref:Uncharacterized protein n=1 Tax=Ficus carica TaxID=3494 RepID=A0AA88J5U5_FICCA|nr:hypothetical protein TIFTF001_032468 [Ficus carica]
MNSNFGKKFDFDLGLGSSRTTSLNDQKNKNSSFSSSPYSSAQAKPAWQPNKPSWTHQPPPAAAPSQPTSMVGDIFGKSWSSSAPSSGIAIVEKNPNLFGDLVNSALGQNKSGGGNVPLKNSAPSTNNKSPFSMRNVADSLPKTSNSTNSNTNWGSSGNNSTNFNTNSYRSPNLSGVPMNNMNSTIGGGGKIGSNFKDPFGSLVDFSGKKPSNPNPNSSTKNNKVNNNQGNDVFGDFQNAPKPTSAPTNTFPTSSFSYTGSNLSSGLNMDDFLKPANQAPPPPPSSSTSSHDPLDMFFTPSTNIPAASNGLGGLQQPQSETDDWGVGMEFGGDDGGPTTELDGLPPPPAGVNASAAKNKGMDNYKQGQYADAIKWLSWAVVLLEKAGDNATEVLSSRASCYKEVGEYKKAVADCTKVLEQDEANVSVLVQRALLYESMEKYRLGAEDLRTVLKIDPGNRIARSTIHRLTKLAD